jgi:hypothetical protein
LSPSLGGQPEEVPRYGDMKPSAPCKYSTLPQYLTSTVYYHSTLQGQQYITTIPSTLEGLTVLCAWYMLSTLCVVSAQYFVSGMHTQGVVMHQAMGAMCCIRFQSVVCIRRWGLCGEYQGTSALVLKGKYFHGKTVLKHST